MSGKAYTMREMRTIVDYLTQQKAYSDIKGRKMWMNFANTQKTNRTWQSLKETFLKRILPDIHNPYYQLNMDQIRSFREGFDVEERTNNRLEIHTISDDSSNNADNRIEKVNEQRSTSNNDNEDLTSGENIKCSQITSRNRSSADTYIVEKCYETAEEVQRDLESPKLNEIVSKGNEISESVQKSTVKSLRDFITYSEPLTPMLQELLDDFASEDESDREPRMEIAEDVTPIDIDKPSNAPIDAPNFETVATEEGNHPSSSKSTTVVEPLNGKESQQICTKALTVKNTENDITQNSNDSIVSADTSRQEEKNVTEENMPKSKPQENETHIIVINDSEEPIATDSEVPPVADSGALKGPEDAVSKTNENATQNCSHTTNDSVLPNNPEAFDKSSINNKRNLKENGNADGLPHTAMEDNISTRKRSNSKHDENCLESKKNKQGCNDDKQIEKMQDQAIIEINSVAQNSNDSKEKSNMYVKQSSKLEEKDKAVPSTSNVGKPKTSNENEVVDVKKDYIEDEEIGKPKTSNENEVLDGNEDDDDDEEIINPCLKSVSLYAEQFNTTKYFDTDYSDVEVAVQNNPVNKKKQDSAKTKDVVILKSHSESETDHIEISLKKPKSVTCVSTKLKKDKALANVFGFSTGGITKSRKKDSRYKKSTMHRYDRNINSFDSSEWTSESDSDDYVSPPRGRKSRHTRKYLKPQFARVLSLEEEGGLFVMNGKKIYPLIKDGKTVKNYTTYLPDSDKEEDDYWKLKYVEERKKTEELNKLLEQFNKEQIRERKSPILQQSTLGNPTGNLKKQSVPTITANKDEAAVLAEPKTNELEHKQENVKLKFTIKNEEVQLEGQWSNINPVLEKVMQVFNSNNNKESTQANDSKSKAVQADSGTSTPIIITVDPEIREKVDQIEKEIFKEIEERDKEDTSNGEANKPVNGDESKPIKKSDQENNVTTRRARQTKISKTPVPSPKSPEKQKQTLIVTEKKEPVKSTKKRRITELENIMMTDSPKKQMITPKEFQNESPNGETRSLRTRKSSVKETASSTSLAEDNADVRYKFPSKKKSRASKSEKINEKKSNKSKENVKTFLSPDSLSRNSIESTQGYQDSDMSPLMGTQLKRKKTHSLSLQHRSKQQLHRNMRRRSTSCLPQIYLTSNSSNSNIWAPVLKVTNDNSSLNTEVYRSESYQLLLPQPKVCIKRLEIIDESSPTLNYKDQINKKLFSSVNRDINENLTKINDTIDSNQGSLETRSSSNVSLPLSPELSIVENLSLSKDMIGSFVDPTINETRADYIADLGSYQTYVISEVDISVPLMEQECELEENHKDRESNNNLYDQKATGVSDSLLNKIGTVKLNENSTLLHSLDQKLHDLLLESAKKVSPPTDVLQNKDIPMEVDVSNSKVTVKVNGKKRCSTPRKRKGTNKSKPQKIYPVTEEEHMELCSHSSIKSCPPYIDERLIQESIINFDETFFEQTNMQTTAPDKPKKKKDIIKVKILRPHDKKRTKETRDIKKATKDRTKLSVNVDSGISDTGLGISGTMLHDSVDLIHNHSETCLQAHECLESSVEVIENSSTSIISIESCSMQSGDHLWQNVFKEFNDIQDNSRPDMIFKNAQEGTNFNTESGLDSPDDYFATPCETVYHSPLATENTSLITEDLSDEIPSGHSHPSTKWYLLSDDETNTMGLEPPSIDFTSSGANLNVLFPIACTVPDLSTITEMSRENDDDSRKPTFKDEDTRNDFDSINTFRKNISKTE